MRKNCKTSKHPNKYVYYKNMKNNILKLISNKKKKVDLLT